MVGVRTYGKLAMLISLYFGAAHAGQAAYTVTVATGGGAISADDTGGSWTTLSGPAIAEGGKGDLGNNKTIVLNVPTGFQFDSGGTAPSITITPATTGLAISLTSRTTTAITFHIDTSSNPSGVAGTVTFGNIRVRPTAGTPLATGNITNSGSTGPANTVSLGTLTEVPGAAKNLPILTQPSSTATVNIRFAQQPVIQVKDQFGNLRSTDNSTQVTASRGTGTGTLSGTTTVTASNGVATFTNLQTDTSEIINLKFDSTGCTQSTSNDIDVSGPATTLAITLVNGGVNPTTGTPFSVVVEAHTAGGGLAYLSQDTAISLSKETGATGTLNGTTTGSIVFGTRSVTISGVNYTRAENGVSLRATVTSGDAISDGVSGTFNVSQRSITVKATAAAKTYDGDTTSAAVPTLFAGSLAVGDVAVYSQTYDDKNAGSRTLTPAVVSIVDGSAADVTGNYSVNLTSVPGSIDPKALSITAPILADKVYDGSNAPGTLTVGTLSGFVTGENVNVSGSASNYASADVGTYSSTVSYTLLDDTGLASNYSLAADTINGNITKASLTITAPSIADKVYNGSAAAGTITTGTVSGLVGTEDIVVNASAADYSSADVGSYTTTVSYTLNDGTTGKAANYNPPADDTNIAGNITKASLTITAPSIADKVYDGSAAAGTITTGTVSGLVGTEDIVVNASAADYSSADVGGYTTTVSYTLSDGTTGKAGNYNPPADDSNIGGNITKASLTITAPSIADKVYDGSAAAGTITTGTVSGLIGTEDIVVNATAADYSSADVGSYTTTVSYTLSNGTTGKAANYNPPADDTNIGGNIAKASLTITAPSIADKVYDGSAAAGVITTGTVSGLVGTEDIVVNASAADYSSADVGSYTTTVSYTLNDGTTGKSANYSAPADSTNVAGNIVKKSLTIGAPTLASKTYDGNASPGTLTIGSVSGLVGSETLSVSGSAANYSSKNVGTYPGVVITYTLTDGTGSAGNYSLAPGAATGTITAKALTVTGITAADKVFTGGAGATLNTTAAALVGVISPDDCTLVKTGAVGTFVSAAVGTNITVNVSGLTLSGADAGNYTVTQPSTTANIIAVLVVNSGPTANPNPATINQAVQFTCNTNLAGSTYVWDFGDGTNDTTGSATVSHTYTVASTAGYTVTATATNGTQSASANLTLVVNDDGSSGGGGGGGGGGGATPPLPLTITKKTLMAKVPSLGTDKLSFSGALNLPVDTRDLVSSVTLTVGSFSSTYSTAANGKAIGFSLKGKFKKKVLTTTSVTFSTKLVSNFVDVVAAAGVPAGTSGSVSIPVTLTINGLKYGTNLDLTITGTSKSEKGK